MQQAASFLHQTCIWGALLLRCQRFLAITLEVTTRLVRAPREMSDTSLPCPSVATPDAQQRNIEKSQHLFSFTDADACIQLFHECPRLLQHFSEATARKLYHSLAPDGKMNFQQWYRLLEAVATAVYPQHGKFAN
jgi:hypothetical protein